MRILWITPGFAANEQDSTCIPPLYLLAQELLRQGVELHIIALEYPSNHETKKSSNYAYYWPYRPHPHPLSAAAEGVGGGVDTQASKKTAATIYPCKGQNRRWLRWRSFYRARRIARQLHAEKKIDALHCFWLGPAWVVGTQIARKWNIPLLTTLMGQDVLPQNRYLRRFQASETERLVALSPFHNTVLEKTCGLRAAHEIPWGIGPLDFPAALPSERPVDILGVGSLIPVKNWFRWLEILHLVAAQKPDIRAELIGAGPQLPALQKRAVQLGLQDQVHFAGSLSRPAVLERMRQSKLLLHTANFESYGFVFAEGAANGCRVVSGPVGAAPAFGTCATTDSDLAAAVLRDLAQPVLEKPRLVYRMEATAQAYLDLYAGK